MNKKEFKAIFDKCMQVKEVHCQVPTEDDGYTFVPEPMPPSITIRDFDLEFPACDKEFTSFEKAWKFFKETKRVRIMDVAGSIYYDNYCHINDGVESQ